jgi:PAS domain S-box-containing protein
VKVIRKNKTEQAEGVEELRIQLFEANCIIDAIKEGAIDALVVSKEGRPNIYALESADFTYRLLVEKSGEGALSISPSGLVLYCNEYFANLVGLPANKIIGTYFNSYIDSVGQFQQLKTALESGPSKGEIVLSIDGRKLNVYASLTSLQPQVAAIGIIITDLTEKRKHEDALAAYRRELEAKVNELNQINVNLEQFIHVITHDIKEPLRKIIAYSDQVLRNKSMTGENEDDIKKLNVINGAAARLNSLVDDLVKYAISNTRPEREEVDLNQVVHDVTEDMAIIIGEKKAELTVRLLPKISGSAVQMRQLFHNLIGNALKYSKSGVPSSIYIACDIEDCIDHNMPNRKFYCISIHDNGIGMDMEQTGRIFTIFHRVHTNGQYSGNGIGLSICKRIVENHFGKIEVDSSPGDGSTFRIYLPFPEQRVSFSR